MREAQHTMGGGTREGRRNTRGEEEHARGGEETTGRDAEGKVGRVYF